MALSPLSQSPQGEEHRRVLLAVAAATGMGNNRPRDRENPQQEIEQFD